MGPQGSLFEPSAQDHRTIQYAQRVTGDVFRSGEEANEALAKYRAGLIQEGHRVGVRLASLVGAVCAQDVFCEMDRLGILTDGAKSLRANWLSQVFVGKGYRDSWERAGRHVQEGNRARNVHRAKRQLWKLRDADTLPGDRPPQAVLRAAVRDMRGIGYRRGERPALDLLVAWVDRISEY